jgi:hypothetical protein
MEESPGWGHTVGHQTQIQVRYALLSIITLRIVPVRHGHCPNPVLTNIPIHIFLGHAQHVRLHLNVNTRRHFIPIRILYGFLRFAIRFPMGRIRQMVGGCECASVNFWKNLRFFFYFWKFDLWPTA